VEGVGSAHIENGMPQLQINCEQIKTGDTSPLDQYEALAGKVPVSV
jgi:hypothetical protein